MEENRLRQHLTYHEESCFRWLQANMHPMTNDQAVAVDEGIILDLPDLEVAVREGE
ncbi:unnamed protein product, partial [Effrenium voratum]